MRVHQQSGSCNVERHRVLVELKDLVVAVRPPLVRRKDHPMDPHAVLPRHFLTARHLEAQPDRGVAEGLHREATSGEKNTQPLQRVPPRVRVPEAPLNHPGHAVPAPRLVVVAPQRQEHVHRAPNPVHVGSSPPPRQPRHHVLRHIAQRIPKHPRAHGVVEVIHHQHRLERSHRHGRRYLSHVGAVPGPKLLDDVVLGQHSPQDVVRHELERGVKDHEWHACVAVANGTKRFKGCFF